MKKRTVAIIVGLIVVAAIIFFVWPRDTQTDTMEVETTAVSQQDFQKMVSTVGIIEPTESENLVGQGLVSEVHVEENEEVAEDDLLVTYADGTELSAPFAGTVIEVNVAADEMDANAQQNQPSVVVADLDDLQVALKLSKTEADDIEVDQDVEMTYLEQMYEGTVSQIDSIATPSEMGGGLQGGQGAPTLNAIVTFDTADTSALVPGFDIDTDIITNTSTDALAIPIEAVLYDDNGNPYVFVVENNVAQAREIEPGIQEGVALEVLNGLSLDEQVVQLPSEDLTDGAEVTVVDENADE